MAAKLMICSDFVGKRLVIAHPRIVQINDNSMKIGIHGDCSMLISM